MDTYSIPSFLHDRRITKYVQELIIDGNNGYYDLDDSYKDEIATLIIDVLGNDSYKLLLGDDDLDKTLHLFSKFLISNDDKYRKELTNQMRTNAHEAYSYHLDNLFREIKETIDWRISA